MQIFQQNAANQLVQVETRQWAQTCVDKLQTFSVKCDGSAAINRLDRAMDKLVLDGRAIQKNEKYADSFKEKELADLPTGAAAEVDKALATAKELVATADKIDSDIKFPEPPDKVLSFLEMSEIRNRLAGKSDMELATLYRKDLQEGKYSRLVQAIESAPWPYDFVTESTLQRSRHNRIKSDYPAKLTEMEDLMKASEAISNFAGKMKSLLK